jgi:hypothetical protein
MTVARRARAIGNLGGLGASHQKLPLSPGEVMPAIRIVSASINYGNKETPIWNGKWLGKKFPAQRNADCLFRLQVAGAGKALIGAVFNDSRDVPCWLFVRRVGPGEHLVSVQIPYAELPKFRFVVAGKADAGIDRRFLSNREKKGLSSNMLLLSETKNAYYTESLGGLGGLGSGHSGMTDDYHPSFIKKAYQAPRKTASGLNTIWSGSITKHRWAKHGFSGEPELGNPKSSGEGKDPGPLYVTDKTGYYAFRGSTYQMRYDTDGTMLGYDAMEKLERGMPAGVPICMVMQYFVHDKVNPGLSSFAGGPHDQLGHWYHSHKINKAVSKGASWVADKTVAVVEDVGDRTINMAEATVDFAKDPSMSNFSRIVTAPLGGNAEWHFCDDVKINGSRIYFVDENIFYGEGDSDTFDRPSNYDALFTSAADVSAIPYALKKHVGVKPTFKHKGKNLNKKKFANLVEWYNPSTKKWSAPMASPPFSFTTNSKGKIKIIFRFPRQLDPKSDASEIKQGIANGYPDYSYSRTTIQNAYPSFSPTGVGHKRLNLLGRIEGKDSVTEKRVTFTQTIGGKEFSGKRSIRAVLFCDPPPHWRSGLKIGVTSNSFDTMKAFKVHIADPAKFTYLDNPEIDFSYYVDGEMKPGSTVVVIGKALGTIDSNNTVLSTRYWVNGIPKEERPELGKKVPSGDTPNYVAQSVAPPNARKPRTSTGKEGTERADFLELVGHITTNDLRDNISVPGEDVLKRTWKAIFGTELDISWFNKAGLTGHDTKDPSKYLIKGSMGETYSFPFSISWFQLPPYYHGPYLDYDDAGQLQQIEGRPYAISNPESPDQQLHILSRTPFGKLMQQKFDVVSETQQQAFLEEEGYTPDEIIAINDMDYDAEDVTEIADLNAREQKLLELANKTHPMDKGPNMIRMTNDWFKANYKFGNKDIKLKPEKQPEVLGAFSNQGNFYVEDVTEKWGTLNGAAYTNDDFDVNMMPLPMPEDEEDAPFIGFAGLSGLGEININDAMKTVGGGTGAAAGAFTVNFLEEVDDLSAGQMILGAGMSAFAIGGIAAITYAVLSGGGAGLGKVISATGTRKAKIINAKAEAKEKTGGAIAGLFSKPKPSA